MSEQNFIYVEWDELIIFKIDWNLVIQNFALTSNLGVLIWVLVPALFYRCKDHGTMFIFILPSIHSCRLNLLIILNQNLPIRDEIDYDFDKILLSYSVFTRFSMK